MERQGVLGVADKEIESLEAIPVYLGIDISVGKANWAAWRAGELFEQGEVGLDGWAALLDRLSPLAVAMEWTGRLAGQWAIASELRGFPAFIIHTNHRAAMCRLAGVSHKDDSVDARMIARYLYLWHDEERRRQFDIKSSVFVAWRDVAPAWELRGLVADMDRIKQVVLAARNRVMSAEAAGQDDRKRAWEGVVAAQDIDPIMQVAVVYAKEHFGRDMELLQTIPGVGEVTALQFIAALFPISRFYEEREGRDVTISNIRKYLRWSPRKEQTGSTMNRTRRERSPSHKLVGILYVSALGIASRPTTSALGARYERRRERGDVPKHAIIRTADALLRCMVAVVRDGRAYEDSEGLSPAAKPVKVAPCPDSMVSQAEAARRLGVSRERISQLCKSGAIATADWNGRGHVLVSAIEERRLYLASGEAQKKTGRPSKAKGKQNG
jgi:hypothetical protein